MNQKAKTKLKHLYIMKMLLEETDENHPITTNEIIERLRGYGVESERKSIYTDIKLLMEFGLDIVCQRGRANKYFIGYRNFELPELKLLVDAVQSSKFITHKKSKELIEKIGKLVSVYEAKELNRNVVVADRVKTMNESIYYNVDKIDRAIQNDVQIRFKYFRYNIDKEIEYKRDGKWYYASPYSLVWSDENYYMVAYYERYNDISNFRVDRMTNIEITDSERIKGENEFNVVDYLKKHFRMFSGETESVRLQFDNSLINVVIDRFGREVHIEKHDENSFTVTVDTVVSDTFYGWLFMFGNRVEILEPERLRKEMYEKSKKNMQVYGDAGANLFTYCERT